MVISDARDVGHTKHGLGDTVGSAILLCNLEDLLAAPPPRRIRQARSGTGQSTLSYTATRVRHDPCIEAERREIQTKHGERLVIVTPTGQGKPEIARRRQQSGVVGSSPIATARRASSTPRSASLVASTKACN